MSDSCTLTTVNVIFVYDSGSGVPTGRKRHRPDRSRDAGKDDGPVSERETEVLGSVRVVLRNHKLRRERTGRWDSTRDFGGRLDKTGGWGRTEVVRLRARSVGSRATEVDPEDLV